MEDTIVQSERTKRFLADIVKVCQEHGLMITPSDYDLLEVWPIREDTMRLLVEAKDCTE